MKKSKPGKKDLPVVETVVNTDDGATVTESDVFSALEQTVEDTEPLMDETYVEDGDEEYEGEGEYEEDPNVVKSVGRFGKEVITVLYDIEALKRDFKTGPELAKFVFDKTSEMVDFQGKSGIYEVAKTVLETGVVPDGFKSKINPHVTSADLIPTEPLKKLRKRSSHLPPESDIVYRCHVPVAHRDPRVQDGTKTTLEIRKYSNGMVTAHCTGPVEFRDSSEKVPGPGGTMRPLQRFTIDPRTEELLIIRKDGTLTDNGISVKAAIDKEHEEMGFDYWGIFVDRPMSQTSAKVDTDSFFNAMFK